MTRKSSFLLASDFDNAAQPSTPDMVDDVGKFLSELRVTNSLLKQVVENLPVAVLVYDWVNRQVIIGNVKFLAMVQLSAICDGFDPLTLIADDQTRDTMRSIISKGFSSTLELRLNLPVHEILALTAISHITVADLQAVLICFLATKPVQDRVDDIDEDDSSNNMFTSRELEVMRLISKGDTNDMIARALHLSVGTVKNYTSDIYRKLNVGRRTEAVLRIKELRLDR